MQWNQKVKTQVMDEEWPFTTQLLWKLDDYLKIIASVSLLKYQNEPGSTFPLPQQTNFINL